MPTYEYRCPEGHEFERFQRMSDPPVSECPVCGADATRVLSGGAGLLFKGEGFYITDYRSESYRKAAAKESGGSEGGSGAGGGSGSGSASGGPGGTGGPGGSKAGGSGSKTGGAGSSKE